jgi:hypothetical protein
VIGATSSWGSNNEVSISTADRGSLGANRASRLSESPILKSPTISAFGAHIFPRYWHAERYKSVSAIPV